MKSEITTISNERFASFCETLAEQARTVIHERADKMLEAWLESMQEATENEEDLPPLKFSLACSVDLAKNRVETKISFATRYTTTESDELPDPNQPEIPGMETVKWKKGAKA